MLQRVTGNTRADDTVPHFTCVDDLANSNTERFLIGGTKKINGLQLYDRTSVHLKHEQRTFLPGDILTIEKLYFGETRKRTRLFRKPKYITEKFLMCRDEADREILLPFEQTGIFYQISHRSGKAVKNVLQMSDIVARKLTPRIIKLVYGRFPNTPCAFTGLMRAESSKIETSIIASTIINTKNILLEIPVTSAMYFRVAIMDDALRKNPCYRGAMGLCAERAMTYMRNIKVCYNFAGDDDTDAASFHAPLLQQQSLPLRDGEDSVETPPQSRRHNQVMKTFSDNKDYQTQRHTCFPDTGDDSVIRPGRCTSTGRMSFCLGNSYLTVPMFEPGMSFKRNSGNNNTFQEAVYTTRRGSKISFNGKFFEEEVGEEEASPELSSAVPPPLACTNIGSYLNIMLPPKITVSGDDDYISTTGSRRPSTQPPTVSPPPLPDSTSTSGVSSGSTSSVSDGTVSNRGSTESFEYAVPKIDDTSLRERSKSSSETATVDTNNSKTRVRRPSTFTFSEGCFMTSPVSKQPSCGVIHDDIESKSDDGSPIYENIKSLLELVTELETHKEDMEEADDETNEESDEDNEDDVNEKSTALTNSTSTQDMLETLKEYIKDESDNENDRKDNACETEETNSCISDNVPKNLDTNDKCHHSSEDDATVDDKTEADIVDSPSEDAVNNNDNGSGDKTLVDKAQCATLVGSEMVQHDTNNDDKTDSDTAKVDTSEGMDNEIMYPFEVCELKSEFLTKRRNSSCEISDTATSDDFQNNMRRNRSHTCGYIDCQIDESSNVRPSDNSNRWRVAVRRLLNESEESIAKLVNSVPRYNMEPSAKTLDMYTVEDIAKQLRSIGIKESSVQHLQNLAVDGESFQKVLDGKLCIKECLNGVNLIDQQKISMFIRGWRPTVD